jgi:hypothetical protein
MATGADIFAAANAGDVGQHTVRCSTPTPPRCAACARGGFCDPAA